MSNFFTGKNFRLTRKVTSLIIAISFIFTSVVSPSYAQVISQSIANLPLPGSMVTVSGGFEPTIIKGLTIHPENPLMFDFIIDPGESGLYGEDFKAESTKLVKYFLAALTVPADELWVNLSPYEKDRIVPDGFGNTGMGRDLLAQDYILKQLTSTLVYPETDLGKKFWDRVYEKSKKLYNTTEVPLNTFNKIWIVPEKAVVFESNNNAFVIDSHLKVMLEEDYVALNKNLNVKKFGLDGIDKRQAEAYSATTTQMIKDVLIPEIEQEVNTGENFAALRQVYNSVILASWYKDNLKNSLLGQIYADKNKIAGIDLKDKTEKEQIYNRYVDAFNKGVYNYIREDYDSSTKTIIPRKYFSGGTNIDVTGVRRDVTNRNISSADRQKADKAMVSSSGASRVQISLLDVGRNPSSGAQETLNLKARGVRGPESGMSRADAMMLSALNNKADIKINEGRTTVNLGHGDLALIENKGGILFANAVTNHPTQYKKALLDFMHQTALETNRMTVLSEKNKALELEALLRGNQGSYETIKGIPNAKGYTEALGDLILTRRILGLGQEKVFQLEINRKGENGTSVLTIKENKDGTTAFRVLPKKTVLAYGYGLVNSRVTQQLLKLGLNVIAANSLADNNARRAINQGVKIVPLDAASVKSHVVAGEAGAGFINAAEAVTALDYLKGNKGLEKIDLVLVDLQEPAASVVVDNNGSLVLEGGKVLTALPMDAKARGLKLVKKAIPQSVVHQAEILEQYDVPVVITQVENQNLIPGAIIETGTMQTANASISGLNLKTVLLPNSDATAQSALLSHLFGIEGLADKGTKIDFTNMRTGAENADGKYRISPSGFADYIPSTAIANNVIANWSQTPVTRNWLGKFMPSQNPSAVAYAYDTDITYGAESEFDIIIGSITSAKADGSFVKAKELKDRLAADRRFAVIGPKAGKKFTPAHVVEVLQREKEKVQTGVVPVWLDDTETGIGVVALVSPLLVEVPNAVSATALMLGLLEDVNSANEEADSLMDLSTERFVLRQSLPDSDTKDIAMLSNGSLQSRDYGNLIELSYAADGQTRRSPVVASINKQDDTTFLASPGDTIDEMDLNLSLRKSYYKTLIEFLYEQSLKTGEMITLKDSFDPNFFRYFLQGQDSDYKTIKGIPYAKESKFDFGNIEGRRLLRGLGMENQPPLFSFEFKKKGEDKTFVLTFKKMEDGSTAFRVIPKKTVMAFGYGTISSQGVWELAKMGFEVIAANRSANTNAQLAIPQGFKVVPLNKDGIQAFVNKGWLDAEDPKTAIDYLEEGNIDLIVEGLDGKAEQVVVDSKKRPVLGPDGKVLTELPAENPNGWTLSRKKTTISAVYQAEVFKKYGVPVLFQGSNDSKVVADGFISETYMMELAGDTFEAFSNQQFIHIISCNTTKEAYLRATLLDMPDLDDQKSDIRLISLRRAGDPGKQGSKLAQGGYAAEIEAAYHHNRDLAAFLKQPYLKASRWLKKLTAAKTPKSVEVAYSTGALMGPHAKFHEGLETSSLVKKDGTFYTADEVKAYLEKNNRMAVVGPEPGKNFNAEDVLNVLANRMQQVQTQVPIVYVFQKATGVGIISLTPQESNVEPNIVATGLLRTGVIKDVKRANNETNLSMNIAWQKRMYEQFMPDAEVVRVRELEAQKAKEKAFPKATLASLPDNWYRGKVIAIRVDYNVPMEGNTIMDDTRISASLPSIKYATSRGAKVVVMSHLGRPKGKVVQKLSLAPVASRLSELIDEKVTFVSITTMFDADSEIEKMRNGEVIVLENTRFNADDEILAKAEDNLAAARNSGVGVVEAQAAYDYALSRSAVLSRRLFAGADGYVFDGFSVGHRADADVIGASYLNIPRVAGFLVLEEFGNLNVSMENSDTVFMGGKKVSDKIRILRNLLSKDRVKKIPLGGAMINAFFAADGIVLDQRNLGIDDGDIAIARELRQDTRIMDKIVLPVDVVVASSLEEGAVFKVVKISDIPNDMIVVDIGPETVAMYKKIAQESEYIFWQGPMGVFELSFAGEGTRGLGEAIVESNAYKAAGGGDTMAAIKKFGLKEEFDYVSKAGGAATEYMEGKVLPGISVLTDAAMLSSLGGTKLAKFEASETMDSRDNPTIRQVVILGDGTIGEASIPSGASTGIHEALELRDGDKSYKNGKGVFTAIKNANEVLAPIVAGMDATSPTFQKDLDAKLLEADGTPNKSKLGANAILGISMASAVAAAKAQGIPLYQYLNNEMGKHGQKVQMTLPVPMFNVLNAGSHVQVPKGQPKPDIQEFMIMPVGAQSFAQAFEWGKKVFAILGVVLNEKGLGPTGEFDYGNEKGYKPAFRSNKEALEAVIEAVQRAGIPLGKDGIVIALDLAASEYYNKDGIEDDTYYWEGRRVPGDEYLDIIIGMAKEYSQIFSFEDAFSQDDWSRWQKFTEAVGKQNQIVGDDIYVTNPERLARGIQEGASNSILIKLNQIGSVSETIQTIADANKAGYTNVISHRSGETEDSFIADLAVGTGTNMIKTGGLANWKKGPKGETGMERMAKYSRLVEIEEELGEAAVYAGKFFREGQGLQAKKVDFAVLSDRQKRQINNMSRFEEILTRLRPSLPNSASGERRDIDLAEGNLKRLYNFWTSLQEDLQLALDKENDLRKGGYIVNPEYQLTYYEQSILNPLREDQAHYRGLIERIENLIRPWVIQNQDKSYFFYTIRDQLYFFKSLLPQTDPAMMGGKGQERNVGGINLNPALLDMQIKRDGNGVPLPINMQQIQNMQIEGFIPVIINIMPVQNLPLLLGLEKGNSLKDFSRVEKTMPREKIDKLSYSIN
ncbi:MAG: phosphopyruvate hydratase [Candidatus Omnitrophica bacterium]|nr:phosphopyruvate hydratase [Candidatus Omnitrophota bacterium]